MSITAIMLGEINFNPHVFNQLSAEKYFDGAKKVKACAEPIEQGKGNNMLQVQIASREAIVDAVRMGCKTRLDIRDKTGLSRSCVSVNVNWLVKNRVLSGRIVLREYHYSVVDQS